jgi:hypothetical protein
MSKTITVRYWGGLGNVLFQISAAVAYACLLNRQFVFENYNSLPNLNNFAASSEPEYQNSLKEYSEEDNANKIPFPEDAANVKLIGFYQDYTFFDKHKENIFEIMGIPKIRNDVLPIINTHSFSNNNLFQPQTPTISLHIRRGDYENMPCYFLLINQYYYKLALLNIANRIATDLDENPDGRRPVGFCRNAGVSPTEEIRRSFNVLVFYEKKASDSAKKIVDLLKTDDDISRLPISFYHFNDLLEEQKSTVSDIEEMSIMSHCDHHIIANSTYSWWSAYINSSPDKIVCYPDRFYNHQLYYLSIKGLQVEGWTPIPAWNPNERKCGCRYG